MALMYFLLRDSAQMWDHLNMHLGWWNSRRWVWMTVSRFVGHLYVAKLTFVYRFGPAPFTLKSQLSNLPIQVPMSFGAFPPPLTLLEHLYELGYQDMETWLQNHLEERLDGLNSNEAWMAHSHRKWTMKLSKFAHKSWNSPTQNARWDLHDSIVSWCQKCFWKHVIC